MKHQPARAASPPLPKRSDVERRFAADLAVRLRAGEILHYAEQAVTFVLGNSDAGAVRYTPDFEVIHADGRIEYVETKGGYVREDADVKFKLACATRPFFSWAMLQWTKKGGWVVLREHNPYRCISEGKP